MKHIRRAVMVIGVSAAMMVVPIEPLWARLVAAMGSAPKDDSLIRFLTWWAAAAIVLCAGLSAFAMHQNSRAH
ncbi:hypothetical protein [Demequina lutea]|uniref:Uncharacterized protein n=1 Tax=Demequina lutea TaxID=431489 RepID=A0A7Y9Z871_9MICO|nr:hypothetical protein [Demequina lutea]NYI40617.1 hypothetical protein [Demequina lutea]